MDTIIRKSLYKNGKQYLSQGSAGRDGPRPRRPRGRPRTSRTSDMTGTRTSEDGKFLIFIGRRRTRTSKTVTETGTTVFKIFIGRPRTRTAWTGTAWTGMAWTGTRTSEDGNLRPSVRFRCD